MRRNHRRRLAVLTVMATLAVSAAAPAADGIPITGDPPAGLLAAIEQVQAKPIYANALWGIRVADRASGAVLLDQAGGRTLVPGSGV